MRRLGYVPMHAGDPNYWSIRSVYLPPPADLADYVAGAIVGGITGAIVTSGRARPTGVVIGALAGILINYGTLQVSPRVRPSVFGS